jgi:deazaflavin-dependent oxidoreductase (nitroreductase family)
VAEDGQTAREEDRMALTDFETALNDTNEIELTTTGRVSGRQTSRPVWFVRQGELLHLLPVTGSSSQWYKNVLKTPTTRLAAGGARYSATAKPLTDPGQVAQVVDSFRAKYGARDVEEYYPNPDVALEITLG